MDLGLPVKRRRLEVISDNLKDLYPHDLNLYALPPCNNSALNELEDLALDRLKIFYILETATNKDLQPSSEEYKEFIYEELHTANLGNFLRLVKSNGMTIPTAEDYQVRRADHLSHFILRYVCCRTTELAKWFLKREVELFRLRFRQLTPHAVFRFLILNNLRYDPISEDEKNVYRNQLMDSTSGDYAFDATSFFKVPFSEVLDLVGGCKVFLKDGFAYVPEFEKVSCVLNVFEASVREGLEYTCRISPHIQDSRIVDLLHRLKDVYSGSERLGEFSVNEVTVQDLDGLSETHYPPCMRHIHESFRSQHHLKHGARLQYMLFLKAIGLSLEGCLKFWEEEFTQRMDEEQFNKQYSYSVKHAYGTVGRMQSHPPYDCTRIINTNVGPGDIHGCPFKHWDNSFLKTKLKEYGLCKGDVEKIASVAGQGYCRRACKKYFEITHEQDDDGKDISHPNQYFQDSYNLSDSE